MIVSSLNKIFSNLESLKCDKFVYFSEFQLKYFIYCVQIQGLRPTKGEFKGEAYVTAPHRRLSKCEDTSDAADQCVVIYLQFEGRGQPEILFFWLTMSNKSREKSTFINNNLAE